MKNKLLNSFLLVIILIGQIHLICNLTAFIIPWFLVFIILTVTTLTLILSLIISVLVSKQKRVWKTSLSITLAIGLTLGYSLSNYQGNQRKTNATLLIKALNQYKTDNGIYPISEKKLIPEYLSKIPTNRWGLQNIGFQYTINKNQSVFSIQYRTKESYNYYYTSSIKEWQFGD